MIDLSLAYAYAGASIGVGIIALGAGIGIGKVGKAAMEAISRQPEYSNRIQTAMIIACALIEGAAVIGAITCLLVIVLK